MPVSSPSYFPPAGGGGQVVGTTAGNGATGVRTFLAGQSAGNSTQGINDLVIVGDHAMSAGTVGAPITDTNLAGTVIVGSGAGAAVTTTAAYGFSQLGSVVVGFNAAHAAGKLTSDVIIGWSAFGSWTQQTGQVEGGNVIVGANALATVLPANLGFGVGVKASVVIGALAGGAPSAGSQSCSVAFSVIIGHQAVPNLTKSPGTGGPGCDQNVVIGASCGNSMASIDNGTGCINNILIGFNSNCAANGLNNVLIGAQVDNHQLASSQQCVVIGASSSTFGNSNTIIGYNIAKGAAQHNRQIVIGIGAGSAGVDLALDDILLIETNDGTRRTMFYGIMCDGVTGGTGVVFGFSTNGTNRDIQGRNTFKILDGAAGGAAPLGGGYFYSSGGRLHWVDEANNDWVLTGTAAGQLASSTVGYTNNAGAQAATITNGPTAGNPTKWIPINDNGTIRNIPAW